jgi:hypothetical protein
MGLGHGRATRPAQPMLFAPGRSLEKLPRSIFPEGTESTAQGGPLPCFRLDTA